MIIYHRHHKIPKHMGGTNKPSNIELISIEEHAQRHKDLFEQFGCWQDKLAWLMLSGQMTKQELTHEKQHHIHLGKPKSEQQKIKMGNSQKKRNHHNRINNIRQKNNTSGFIGVSWYKASQKWRADVGTGKKKIYLGLFNTKEDAYNKIISSYSWNK